MNLSDSYVSLIVLPEKKKNVHHAKLHNPKQTNPRKKKAQQLKKHPNRSPTNK